MNTHGLDRLFRRRNLAAASLLSFSLLIMAFGFAPSDARSPQDGYAGSATNERRFENTVPEHVPIKVKLKSEKSFKELKNKNWARELEIEVKNTGSKPIYYLYVIVVMPDVLVEGHRLTMRTAYGRAELGLPETPVEPGDVPVLLPGESFFVKLPEGKVRAYEQLRDEQGRPDPKVVEFEIQAVKFGDGTSFRGRDGKLWREATKKQPSNALPPEGEAGGCKPTGPREQAESPDGFLRASYEPASLLRAHMTL